MIELIVLAIIAVIGVAVFGGSILTPINNILLNVPLIIGLCAASAGVWMMAVVYPKSGKDQDKYIGMAMILVGAVIGISGSFIDIIKVLFGNVFILLIIIGGILLLAFKKEGLIK